MNGKSLKTLLVVLALTCLTNFWFEFTTQVKGDDEFSEQVGDEDEDAEIITAEELGSEAKFANEDATAEGVVMLENGVSYKVIKKHENADAKSPLMDSMCKLHYRGTLGDGVEFDSSYKKGEPAFFRPENMIKGWQIILPLMREGDKWQVFVPNKYAYGDSAVGDIPAGSDLVFEIHLLEVDPQFEGMDAIRMMMREEIKGLPVKLQVWQALALIAYVFFRIYMKRIFKQAKTSNAPAAGGAKAKESKKSK